MRILNFGSMNLDYVYQVPHFLAPGETMAALNQQVHPGGKGLNQSIAMARAGVRVYHAGVIGQGGEQLAALLEQEGVDTRYLLTRPCLQGNAIIQVTPQGENCILLYGGSNQAVTEAQVSETLRDFGPGDLLVVQNEVSCLPQMIAEAAAHGMQVALNPSPFDQSLRTLPYEKVSWLFINEVEGAQMTGCERPDDILRTLRLCYPGLKIVLTLGGDGALCDTPEGWLHQPIFPVQAVDTTAAGDTFSGYFLAGLVQGMTPEACMRRAAAASAIAVSRPGASGSIPRADEVESMLANKA